MDISVAPAVPASPSQIINLAQFGRLLRRYAPLIGSLAIAGGIAGFFYAHSVPKTYTANATISVEGAQFDIPELQGAVRSSNAPDPMPWVRTEVQALSSRALVQQVINEMHLADDPEFNPYLRAPSLVAIVKNAISALLPQSTAGGRQDPDAAVLGSVEKSLGVFQDNRSLVIALAFTAEDPRLASDFLNRLLTAYVQSRAANRNSVNAQANKVLVDRTTQAKANLDAIEQQMQDLRSKSGMVTLRAGGVSQQELEDLASAAARASLQRSQLEADWDRATELAKQGLSDALVSVLNSPTISRLRDQESEAASRYADLTSRYGSAYPAVRSAAANLAAVRRALNGEVQRIVDSMGAQVKVARDQEAQVDEQLAAARKNGELAQNADAQMAQLQEEEKSRRAIYQALLVSEQQTAAQPTAADSPDVRIISGAVPPGLPSGPNTKLITGMGGLTGALLGCLFAFTRLHRLEDAEEFSRGNNIPVMASVPHRLVRGGAHGLAARVAAQPPGAETELARNLRNRISFIGRSNVPRVVMLCASRDNDSAAIIAAAIARVAASDGERVLLIEANLASPQLAKAINAGTDGIAEVLTDFADWHDVVARDNTDLDLLLATRRLSGADALLAGPSFQSLVMEAAEEYDLVVIAAPSADSADAATVAEHVDAALVVADLRARRADLATSAARLSAASRNPVHGILVS